MLPHYMLRYVPGFIVGILVGTWLATPWKRLSRFQLAAQIAVGVTVFALVFTSG